MTGRDNKNKDNIKGRLRLFTRCSGMLQLGMVVILLMVGFDYADAARQSQPGYQYVLNLMSSVKPIASDKVSAANVFKGYSVYQMKFDNNQKYKYRMRLGFFVSKKQAIKILQQVKVSYPGAWLDSIKKEDNSYLTKWSNKIKPDIRPGKLLSYDDTTELMEKARVAMVARDYQKAIRFYTRVVNLGAIGYQQEAQEYIGVARERNGQLAHAKAEYRLYLKKFPEGENASRVEQRLAGLVTAYDSPKQSLKQKRLIRKPAGWEFFGLLLQYYDHDVVDTELLGRITANSSLATSVNYSGRLYNSDYKMRANVSGVHVYDVNNSETDDQRLTSLYLDILTPDKQTDLRVGRQKGRSMGVIGRYDGIDVSQRLSSFYKLKLIAGYPYESSQTVDSRTDKYFYSVGVEMGPINKYWDASMYVLQQYADGIIDRDEVGAEVRYRNGTSSLFTLFDYSVAFNEINYLMAVYNFQLVNKSTLDLIFDYRKSPFLTTTSALQGQVGLSTLADLLDVLTEEEIEQLSLDRTSLYKSLSVLYTQPLTKKLEFNADFNVSNLSGTGASAGVEAIEGTGNEYSVSAGLIGNNILTVNDINIINLRFSQLYNSDVMVLNMNAKYRLRKDWRIGPRLRYENRDYEDGRKISKLRPSIKVDYRRNKSWQFEMEAGIESKDTKIAGNGTESETSYLLHMGYIYSF